MPTYEDAAFAGIVGREGFASEEELERSLQLLEALHRIDAPASLHGVLVAEGRINIAQANRILAHQHKVDLLCPACETSQSAIRFPLKPVFRCRSCSTELPVPDRIQPAQVDVLRARIRDVLLWHEAESLAGQTMGGIQLLRRFGHGVMGAVYAGMEVEGDRPVAIRVLPKSLGENPSYLEAFRFEADVMSRVSHPNVVQVHRTGEERGRHFVVMERAAGTTLAQLIAERGPLPVKKALAIITQAAQGLQAAHERGLVHRDVKPANIVWTEAGIVKVADFGLAKNRGAAAESIGAGRTLGSPTYLSPEQAAGRAADARSDVYSLGVSFYHALVGHPPFPGDDPVMVLNSHIHDTPRPPHLLRPDIPKDVSLVATRMLAKRPEDRYAGVPALLASLRKLSAAPDDSAQRAIPPSSVFALPRYRASSIHLMIVMVLGAGALAMAAWIVLQVFRTGGIPTAAGGISPGIVSGEYISKSDEAVMVLVAEGPFPMGSEASLAGPCERPAREVHLKTYLIDKHEVSNARYQRFLDWIEGTGDHSACHPDEPADKDHRPWASGEWTGADRPVVGIDWYDACAYAAWAGKRLPTEAEWEKAARPDGKVYPWGNSWEPGRANSAGAWAPEGIGAGENWDHLLVKRRPWEKGALTRKVTDLQAGASPFGILQMAGNVREWVQDWFDPAAYASGQERDPSGPPIGYERTVRGGSWRDPPDDLRATIRRGAPPASRSLHVGFRTASDFNSSE